MALHCRANDGQLLVVFGSPHQLKKNVMNLDRPPLKKLSGSAYDTGCRSLNLNAALVDHYQNGIHYSYSE